MNSSCADSAATAGRIAHRRQARFDKLKDHFLFAAVLSAPAAAMSSSDANSAATAGRIAHRRPARFEKLKDHFLSAACFPHLRPP